MILLLIRACTRSSPSRVIFLSRRTSSLRLAGRKIAFMIPERNTGPGIFAVTLLRITQVTYTQSTLGINPPHIAAFGSYRAVFCKWARNFAPSIA